MQNLNSIPLTSYQFHQNQPLPSFNSTEELHQFLQSLSSYDSPYGEKRIEDRNQTFSTGLQFLIRNVHQTAMQLFFQKRSKSSTGEEEITLHREIAAILISFFADTTPSLRNLNYLASIEKIPLFGGTRFYQTLILNTEEELPQISDSDLEERLEQNRQAAREHRQTQQSFSHWNDPASFTFHPISTKHIESAPFVAGIATSPGRRKCQEDRVFADTIQIDASSTIAVFGICDGHGGSESAAEYVSEEFTQTFIEQLHSLSPHSIWSALNNTCRLLHQRIDRAGTTLTTAVIFPEKDVWVANVGDSRAITVSLEEIEQITEDMQLDIERYRRQVLENGGSITRKGRAHYERINNYLNMAGSLGDPELNNANIYLPEITRFSMRPEQKLILGTDGIFQAGSTNQIGQFVQERFDKDPVTISEEIINRSLRSWDYDNATVIVIEF